MHFVPLAVTSIVLADIEHYYLYGAMTPEWLNSEPGNI